MSYASDHRAWQQRINKEAGRAKLFTETFVPIIDDTNSPMKGLADKYSSKYGFADPNAIAKYDLKNTISEMEVTLKGKAKRKMEYLKSCSNQPNDSNASTNYQTTSRNMYAPNTISKNGLKLNASHKQNELRAMLAQVDTMNAFETDHYPRAKNFFHQAYLAKSKIDNISQSSKMSRARSYKQIKTHYPPGHPKASNLTKGLSKLPAIKAKRFNEDAASEYSTHSRRSSVPKLHTIQAFVPQNKVPSKANNYDTSHLSQKSGRVEDLKNTLINSIEQMNDKEVNVMRSAVGSVKNHELRSRQVRV
jgi:hypothetical protein